MKRIALLTVFGLLVLPRLVPAQRLITVGKGGGYDCSTIQAAIDAAANGDEIIVSPAIYVENINFKGKNITLRSTVPTSPSVVARTIIDGHQAGSVVTFAGSERTTCVIEGFTITRGSGFRRNPGDLRGCGIWGNGTRATIQNNVISTNTAFSTSSAFGGGISSCHGLIQNNTISNNSIVSDYPFGDGAMSGGGGLVECDGVIQNNRIFGNSCTADMESYGGGLYCCDGTIQNNVIFGNSADFGGGLTYCNGTIQNNTIFGNSAQRFGGGLCRCEGTIWNNTIFGNSAEYHGGGLDRCDATIRNCIVWGNSGLPVLFESSTPSYCCIENWSGGGVGNITANPQLTDPTHGDFHLLPTSPCIDAGGTVTLTQDFEGDPRPFDYTSLPRGDGSNFDIGADEAFSPAPLLAVSPSTLGNSCLVGNDAPTQTLQIWNMGIGTIAYTVETTPSWLVAMPLVGSSDGPASRTTHRIVYHTASLGVGDYSGAIRVSDPGAINSPVSIPVTLTVLQRPGGTITVGKGGGYDYGTIQRAIDAATAGNTIVVYPATYPENINFKGKNIVLRSTDPWSSSVVAATVIVSAAAQRPVVTFQGTEGATCVLSGFTVTGGLSGDDGAGIRGNGTHAMIDHNHVIGNEYGAGFSGGGGIAQCHGLIQYNLIADNKSNYWGGGLIDCQGVVRNNIICRNYANVAGGGVMNCDDRWPPDAHQGQGVFQNNLIYSNTCDGWGGGLADCKGVIQNNTIWGNTSRFAGGAGGGLHGCSAIRNCIVWANTAPTSPQVSNSSLPAFSCIQDWTGGGVGNIATDPQLFNPAGGDFHLGPNSPCIDAGGTVSLATDYEGDPRPFDYTSQSRGDGSNFDIGADEAVATAIGVAPAALNNSCLVGNDAPTQTLQIWNAGNGVLAYTVAASPSWLVALPLVGSSDGPASRTTHRIVYHTASLGLGNHNGTIVIANPAAFNSPISIPVTVTVRQLGSTITVGKGGGYDYSTIQAAINAAANGDEIIVSPATYVENINFKGKSVIVRSSNPTDWAIVSATIIDGRSSGTVVTFAGTETSSCVLSGFTIRNGKTTGQLYSDGSGIEGRGAHALIEYNTISGNEAGMGGGIDDCQGTIRNNTIAGNIGYGGGLQGCNGLIQNNTITGNTGEGGGLAYCSGLIQDNIISDNVAPRLAAGGGLYGCNGQIRNNIITGNVAGPAGGGLCDCDGVIQNNLIANNRCAVPAVGPTVDWGWGAGLINCDGTIVNNTITSNSALVAGGGLWRCAGTIVDCIVWGNAAPESPQIGDSTSPTYSCIQGWTGGGTGNISSDPLFTTGPLGPYYLSQIAAGQSVQSSCVDAGSSTALALGLAGLTTRTDGAGDLGAVDMGFHYAPAPPIPPTASTIPARFDYTILAGTDVGSKTLSVQNTGNGVLRFTIAASESWISIVPTSGTSRGELSIHQATFATRGLAAGVHTANVVITVESPPGVVQLPVVITVLFPAGPNLTVSHGDIAPAAPAQVPPGSTITLGAFIENVGTSPARPFWTEVWGSRTGGLTLDRFLADSLRLPDGLPGNGASWSWITTASLYSIPDGPYTVVYAVDRPGDVTEGNERDNRAVVRAKRLLVIRPPTQADLAVEGFGMSPNPAMSSEAVAFAGRVVNRGAEACGPFWIEFWGSWDRPFPNLNFFLCDSIFVENLDAGASADLSAFPRRLYDVPTGIFMVGCVADRDDSINELNEANNYQFVDGQVFNSATRIERAKRAASGGADISVTDADFSPAAPTQVAPGDTIVLTVELENIGNGNTGPFWLEYWGSRDGGLTLSDFLSVSDRVANLAPGARARLSSAKALWGVPDGPYSVVVFADRPGDVTEADRANNRAGVSGKRLLVIRPPTGANLGLTSFSLSSGQWPDIGLGGAVRNAGTSDSGPFWIEFWVAPGDPDYPWLDRYARDSIHVDNLAPDGMLNLYSYPASFYGSLPAGEYVLIGFVDRLDQVMETDETDNYQLIRHFAVPAH